MKNLPMRAPPGPLLSRVGFLTLYIRAVKAY